MTGSALKKILRNRSFRYFSVLLATAAVYFSTLSAGFVQWDDKLLTENLALRGLSSAQLSEILLPQGGAYQPVRNLVFLIGYQIWKFDPFGYHLVNLLLYLLVVFLAFRVLEALVRGWGSSRGADSVVPWIGAALFAVHPLHVEAVAWVQGNKDLLASVFFLAAFLSYVKYSSGREGLKFYWLSYVLFLLALGSKPSAAAFPLVILAFDLLLVRPASTARGSDRSDSAGALFVRYLPYLIPAALLAVYFTFFTAAVDRENFGGENLLAIPRILWSYYRLILLPVGLLHRYLDPVFTGAMDFSFLAGTVISAGVIYSAIRLRKRYPLISFGIAWFYVCWLPQSNLVPIAIRVADRYIFLSLLGVCLIAALLAVRLHERLKGTRAAMPARLGLGALLVLLAALSLKRCQDWSDGEQLWKSAIAREPQAAFFYKGLAEVYMERGELEAAYENFSSASALSPGDSRSLTSQAYIRKRQGRLEEAETLYNQALELDKGNFYAINSLGNIYAQQGLDSLAAEFYQRAIVLRPEYYMAYFNLASLYRNQGRTREADSLMLRLESVHLPQPAVLLKRGMDLSAEGELNSARVRFERAISLDADLIRAYDGLGKVYLKQDSLEQAIACFRRVLSESVAGWSTYSDLGLVFNRAGNPDSAIYYYRKAYALEPDSASTTIDLAVLLNKQNQTEEAVELAEHLLEKEPRNFMALRNLGNWLAAMGRNEEAAEHYSQALELNPNDANIHYSLGRLYIQFLNRPVEAREHLEKSLDLDPGAPFAPVVRQVLEQMKAVLK